MDISNKKLLSVVGPRMVNEYWNDIRSCLYDLLDRAPDTWKVEDVYMDIMTGSSVLYIAEDEDGLKGFTILKPFQQYGDLVIHIWIAYNKREHDNFLFAMDEVKDIAESMGARYITFSSKRKGCLRLCNEIGFVPSHQHFIYEV